MQGEEVDDGDNQLVDVAGIYADIGGVFGAIVCGDWTAGEVACRRSDDDRTVILAMTLATMLLKE